MPPRSLQDKPRTPHSPCLSPPAFRKRNSPRRRTGLPCVRDRFDAVEIPLKRTRKSQKARRIPFLSLMSIMAKDLAAKPQSQNATRLIRSAVCTAGFRIIQNRMPNGTTAQNPAWVRASVQAEASWPYWRRQSSSAKNQNPLRRVSSRLIGPTPFHPQAGEVYPAGTAPGRLYFFFSAAFAVTGTVSGKTPFRMSSAAGGRGLSAFASSRLTCHIWSWVSTSLKARHAGQADAVSHLPVGLSRRIIADADHGF